MAEKPLTKVDAYQNQWHSKYGEKPVRNHSLAQTQRSGLFSTNQFIDHNSPMSTRTRGTLQLPQVRTNLKLDPMPFRFTSKDQTQRIADTLASQSNLDTQPVDVDKKAFTLRKREHEKELAHSKFRTKSFSTVDRLNHMYEDDLKILDCEVVGPNAGTINAGSYFKSKKRLSMPQATIRHKKLKELQKHKESHHQLTPEEYEKEKKKIISKFSKIGISDPSSEQIHDLIMKNIKQSSKENQDLGNRNYMLPTYHAKTHFKGATTLHLQCAPSLKSNIATLREEFALHKFKQANDGGQTSEISQDDELRGGSIEPAEFTKAVLQNCGEYRRKDMKVIPTERGTGFMRKLSSIQSIDPARTFFGAGSKVAAGLYGNATKEALESNLLNSKRHIALASQKGGMTQSNFLNTSQMSFGGGSKSFAIKVNPPIFANRNVSIQNLDIKARIGEKRAAYPKRISAAEMFLGSKDDTISKENDDTKNYDKEYHQEIADDDSFFNDHIPMGQKPDYQSLMEVNQY